MMIKSILTTFGISEKMTSCEPITEGHINQTYLVKTEYEKEYILQHINSHALQYPEQMMHNIVKVAEYLRNSKSLLQIPHFYQTATGEYLFQNWRIMDKIQGITLKNSNDLKVIHSMGCAFGAFHQGLAEFPLTELADTFHDFHNTQIRFSNLWNAVRQDHFHKASQITEELQQLHDYENRACLLQKMKFPMRVLHGDMKRSNVLLNPNNFEPVAVIDLDTLMTGTILTDYGDAVRSLMGTTFDISKYQAFESGYLESAQFLTKDEKEYLIPSAFCMTIELATRYAEDYLNNDIYFHTDSLKRLRELLSFAGEFTVF